MTMVVRYIVGIILVIGFIFLCVKSIISIVEKVRDFIKRKKSPVESKKADDVKADAEVSGKEVDKQ